MSAKRNPQSKSTAPATPIPFAEFWNKSKCAQCGSVIRKGAPRCVVMFAELDVGPGSRAFRDDEDYGLDEDKGLIMNSSATIAMCRPCACEFAQLKIENPWFALREQLAAEDPGGSVWATPTSQLNISSRAVAEDYAGGASSKHDLAEAQAAAQNDAQDRFISMHAEGPLQAIPTQKDYRNRMRKFLIIADSRAMSGDLRKLCELWAEGKKAKADQRRNRHQPVHGIAVDPGWWRLTLFPLI